MIISEPSIIWAVYQSVLIYPLRYSNDDNISFDDAVRYILREAGSCQGDATLAAISSKKSGQKGNPKQSGGSGRDDGTSKKQKKKRDMSKVRCFKCDQLGHM